MCRAFPILCCAGGSVRQSSRQTGSCTRRSCGSGRKNDAASAASPSFPLPTAPNTAPAALNGSGASRTPDASGKVTGTSANRGIKSPGFRGFPDAESKGPETLYSEAQIRLLNAEKCPCAGDGLSPVQGQLFLYQKGVYHG